MYFVYQTRFIPHGNTKAPDWCLIDFKEKGLRTGLRLHEKNNWVWGEDIYQEIKNNPEKFLIVEAKDFEHLKETKEYKEKHDEFVLSAIKPNSKLGWIAPDGTFIGCDYYDHAFVAEYYLHSEEKELEKKGWCKIYALNEREADLGNIWWYTKTRKITAAQNEIIIKLGMGDHCDFVI